jgi:site-specific recombinase XerD
MGVQVEAERPIDQLFRRKGFRARLRRSFFAPHWDGFIEAMRGRGYSRYVIYRSIEIALPLSEHAAAAGITDVRGFGDDDIERYLAHRCFRESRTCIGHMMAYLRSRGVVGASRSRRLAHVGGRLLDEYAAFQRDHRGITEHRLDVHRHHVAMLLAVHETRSTRSTIARLTPSDVHAFVTSRAAALGRSERKSMCAALRSFFRFLLLRGYVTRDLASCVPVIPSFKLDRLPRVIAREDIDRILAVVDRSTPVGRRDYAIMLLLASYGVRAGQICALRLDDLDWRRRTIRIRAAKGGRDTVLPLLVPVGEALIAYLRKDRPAVRHREVFLRVRAPLEPLGGSLSPQIRPYARKAGVAPPYNAHAWRHACATRMLGAGEQLKTIRDVLGHRSIESTFIYTKVDVGMLRYAALDWPVSP